MISATGLRSEVEPMLVQSPDHIALGHDPADTDTAAGPIRADDHHRADVLDGQFGQQRGHRGGLGDGRHRRTLGAQNVGDAHEHSRM